MKGKAQHACIKLIMSSPTKKERTVNGGRSHHHIETHANQLKNQFGTTHKPEVSTLLTDPITEGT
jgi:hypothetical protein